MNKLSRVGIDLAKNVFQLHGVDRNEQTVWRRRLTRGKWLKVLLQNVEPGCEIGMEACAGAHHWARQLMQRGLPGQNHSPAVCEALYQEQQERRQ